MNFTATGISQLIAATGTVTFLLIAVLTAALRFAVRPLLADWTKLRNQGGTSLEQRVAELEAEVRQLKGTVTIQLPAESLRTPDRSRT